MAKQNPLSVQQKIGLRIRELRNKAKYSQENLGYHSGLDRTYINSVENGRRNISIRAISQISSALKVSLKAGFPCQPFYISGVSKKNALCRPHGFNDPTQGTLFFEIKHNFALLEY